MFAKHVNLLISPKATSLLKHCASEKTHWFWDSGLLPHLKASTMIRWIWDSPGTLASLAEDATRLSVSVGRKIGFHSPSSGKNHAAY